MTVAQLEKWRDFWFCLMVVELSRMLKKSASSVLGSSKSSTGTQPPH